MHRAAWRGSDGLRALDALLKPGRFSAARCSVGAHAPSKRAACRPTAEALLARPVPPDVTESSGAFVRRGACWVWAGLGKRVRGIRSCLSTGRAGLLEQRAAARRCGAASKVKRDRGVAARTCVAHATLALAFFACLPLDHNRHGKGGEPQWPYTTQRFCSHPRKISSRQTRRSERQTEQNNAAKWANRTAHLLCRRGRRESETHGRQWRRSALRAP